MCGVVDANVVNEVFGDNPSPAGERFFEWLASPGRTVGRWRRTS